jgi:hypothetical protein
LLCIIYLFEKNQLQVSTGTHYVAQVPSAPALNKISLKDSSGESLSAASSVVNDSKSDNLSSLAASNVPTVDPLPVVKVTPIALEDLESILKANSSQFNPAVSISLATNSSSLFGASAPALQIEGKNDFVDLLNALPHAPSKDPNVAVNHQIQAATESVVLHEKAVVL